MGVSGSLFWWMKKTDVKDRNFEEVGSAQTSYAEVTNRVNAARGGATPNNLPFVSFRAFLFRMRLNDRARFPLRLNCWIGRRSGHNDASHRPRVVGQIGWSQSIERSARDKCRRKKTVKLKLCGDGTQPATGAAYEGRRALVRVSGWNRQVIGRRGRRFWRLG